MHLMVQIHLLYIFPLVLVEPDAMTVTAAVEVKVQPASNLGLGHQA